MIKFPEKVIFEHEDHRKCHSTLLKILNDGTNKPNIGMILRLTKGVSKNLFKPQCLNASWKIEFISLVKKEAQKWEKEGGSVAEKLRSTLQDIVNSKIQIFAKDVCIKAGVILNLELKH